MSPQQELRQYVDAFIEKVSETGELSPEEAARILGELEAMQGFVIERVKRPELRPYRQQEPDIREASLIMARGRDIERAKIKEKEEREALIAYLLQTIFDNLPKSNQSQRKKELTDEALMAELKALAKKLTELRRPSSKEIARILMGHPLVRNYYGVQPESINTCLTEEPEEKPQDGENPLRKAVAQLKTELSLTDKGVTEGFRKLRTDFYDLRVVDPDKIWKEIDSEKDTDMLAACAEEANNICEELFGGGYTFHEEVRAENKVKDLQRLTQANPANEKAFEIFKGACTKLELIHLIYYVRQIRLPYLQQVSRRLQQRFDRIIDSTHYSGRVIINPPAPKEEKTETQTDTETILIYSLEGDEYHCEVDRVEVAQDTKPIVSILRKIILKSLQKPEFINDIVRCRIIMPEFVSQDDELLQKEIEKIIGIILTEFGTDYDSSRIRYTLSTGGSNQYSKGKHKGVHLTLKMRFRIPETGIYPDGAIKEGATDIEIQVLGHMSQDESSDDHREYDRGKADDVMKKLGVDISFKDFVLQLAQVVNINYDFKEDYAPSNRARIGNIPFIRGENLREKLLLAYILTTRNDEGELINKELLSNLLQDIDARTTIMQALRKMKRQKKYEIKSNSDRQVDITRSIRARAKEAEEMLKIGNIGPLKTTYRAKKTKSGNWVTMTTVTRGKASQDSESGWNPYIGSLYMIREESDGNGGDIRFYTIEAEAKYACKKGGGLEFVGSKETSPILTHIIRGEEGYEKCFIVTKHGEILLWERVNNATGEKVVRRYNYKGEFHDEIEDNLRITRKGLKPMSFALKNVEKYTALKRTALRNELEKNHRAKPKLQKGQTIIYL